MSNKAYDAEPCGCWTRVDYDRERIKNHCKDHCPKVQKGQWQKCKGC